MCIVSFSWWKVNKTYLTTWYAIHNLFFNLSYLCFFLPFLWAVCFHMLFHSPTLSFMYPSDELTLELQLKGNPQLFLFWNCKLSELFEKFYKVKDETLIDFYYIYMSFGRPQLYNLEAMPFTYSVGVAMTRIRFSRQTLLIENSVNVFFVIG